MIFICNKWIAFSYDNTILFLSGRKVSISMESILKLQDIQYTYHSLQGETKALQHITFDVKKGEFLAIVGPSGCGKSTLLSIIAGLIKPESGELSTTFSNPLDFHTSIGYMMQRDHLFEWRTVYQNAILGLELQHLLTQENLAYVNQLLYDYNLFKFKDKHPSELSGGMKQRVALIRTLALNPQLLLMDEPFSALDFQTRLLVSNDISQLIRNTGKTMILITHDLSEAISIADRVIILSQRPAYIKKIVPIQLNSDFSSPLARRNTKDFSKYFNLLWEELSNETAK